MRRWRYVDRRSTRACAPLSRQRMKLRQITRADWATLLGLNLASVRELSELDEQRLESLLSWTQCSLAVENEGAIVAFALAIAPARHTTAVTTAGSARGLSVPLSRPNRRLRCDAPPRARRAALRRDGGDGRGLRARGFARSTSTRRTRPRWHSMPRVAISRSGLEHPGGKVVALLTKELASPARHHR